MASRTNMWRTVRCLLLRKDVWSYCKRRQLFTDESLGLVDLDNFCAVRRQRLQASSARERHWHRMGLSQQTNDTAMAESSHSAEADLQTIGLVLTDDLKNSIALAENAKEFQAVTSLFGRYCEQNEQSGLFSASISPLILRLFHRRRCVSDVYQMMTVNWSKWVDRLECYQVAMDLLYECGEYEKVQEIWQSYRTRSNLRQSLPFPRTLMALVIGSCYQQNSRESYEYAVGLLGDCNRAVGRVDRKSLVFAVVLAIHQTQLGMAYELWSMIDDETVTTRSLCICLLTHLGRFGDALSVLAELVASDAAALEDVDVAPDVLSTLADGLHKATAANVPRAKEDLKRFQSLRSYLTPGGRHVSPWTLKQLIEAQVTLEPGQKDLMDVYSGFDETEENALDMAIAAYEDDSSALASVESFRAAELASTKTDGQRRRRRRTRTITDAGKQKVFDGVAEHIRKHGPIEQ